MYFNNFVGNDATKKRLDEHHLSHAYIISGPSGSGRNTLAINLAAAFLCEDEGPRPCMNCKNCRKVFSKIHPDVKYIDIPEKKKSLSIDQIRELRADAYIRPNDANGKIYIVENADTMESASQNALLKILEEPPMGVCIILIGKHPGDFLSTIRSRCSEIALEILPDNKVFDHLKNVYPQKSTEALNSAVSLCEGCIGKAISILDSESDGTRELVDLFVTAVSTRKDMDILSLSQELETYNQPLDDFVNLSKTALVKFLENPSSCPSLDKDKILATILMLERISNYQKFNVSIGHISGYVMAFLLSQK